MTVSGKMNAAVNSDIDKSQTGNKQSDSPSISLPKGGGAIRGIGEKFAANPVTGTGSMSVPLFSSSGRSDFGPKLSLNYDSGTGNGPFGLGWNIDLPSITRKTEKGLPRYIDNMESDVFILSGSEDLVPVLIEQSGSWVKDSKTVIENGETFTVQKFRPRIESSFSLIERWTNNSTGVIHWRTVTRDNVTSLFGILNNSRIFDNEETDPQNPKKIYQWLLSATYDSKGNCIVYEYKEEDGANVNFTDLHEKNRSANARSSQRYIKRILYGNVNPWYTDQFVPLSLPEDFHFELVFDYGDHDEVNPLSENTITWPVRPDPFSSYRSGFEIRTYRLCKRVLMFHNFPLETDIGNGYLVRSTDITYGDISDDSDQISSGVFCFSYIESITQHGYIKKTDGSYIKKSFPPVTFEYSKPVIGGTVKEINPEKLEGVRLGRGSVAEWIDLYGEGTTGILARYENGWMYKRNVSPENKTGSADFSSFEPVNQIPSMDLVHKVQFMDLCGDGHPDMVVLDREKAGFYELDYNEKLDKFRNLDSIPGIDFNDPNLRIVDLTGDGLADILITECEVITWYQSKGEEGYCAAQSVFTAANDELGPRVVFADTEQSIFLADMSGDGLSDIVRIRNGEVCYWPNLGYGKFGAKITFNNFSSFDSPDIFDQKRILLADIDGSGLTDVLYLSAQGVQIYFNLSGNSLSDPCTIGNVPTTDSVSTITAFDLLGNGTACLVWSSTLPGELSLRYVELMSEGKPHLLTRVDNNRGAETIISYSPSTKFYLQDKRDGKPWATRLSFPVHVVEQIETIDNISKSKLTTRYTYHHGYYDGTEREFRGFGMVETIDTETFEEYSGDEEHYVAPVLTRTWIHTGAPLYDSIISRVYEREYWNGDPDAFLLPDTVLPSIDASERNEALRALKGTALRKEIYELGKNIPYQVIESNYTVKRFQPRDVNKHAVFFTHAHETITFHYEQNATDPRIGHEYVLEVDEFGNTTKSASLVYPRRPVNGVQSEQQKPYVTVQKNDFINSFTEGFYLVGVPFQTINYEIGGDLSAISSDDNYDFEAALALVESTIERPIAYNEPFDPDMTQARLNSWTRKYFWNEEQTAALAIGSVTGRALLHHEEMAVFTPQLLSTVFSTEITNAQIMSAGYKLSDGYWWNPGIIQTYQNGYFYLPVRNDNPLGGYFIIGYDRYNLSQVLITDALSNTTSAEFDYRTLQPVKLTDSNGNVSEVITDPLGMVIATSVYGSEAGVQKGDLPLRGIGGYSEIDNPSLADVISDPHKYLQNATSFFYYDLNAWYDRFEPPQFIGLARETHVRDLLSESTTRVQINIGYSDGFGRELQSKVKIEPGIAWVHQSDGTYSEQTVTDRWLVSGRTVYNNKQKPVKQYEPFYSATYHYEPEEFFATYGVTPVIHYDPLLRVVRTDTPKGFFSNVDFTPWEIKTFDENDTVKDSDYYQKFSTLPAAEQDALRKAELHYNTPSVQILDTLGRAFKTIKYKLDISRINDSNRDDNELITYTEFTITGRPETVTDPRQYSAGSGVKNFQYTYAMDENVIQTISVDAGTDRVFVNVMNKPVISFDSRGHKVSVEYDLLHRPVLTHVSGNGLDNTTERLIYGESQTNPQVNNLRGKVYKHYDQAGVVTVSLYSFKGEPRNTQRQIRKEYKEEANWVTAADWNALLENEVFTSEMKYDALGKVSEQIQPDGSSTKPEYHMSGRLNKVNVRLKNESSYTEFVSGITYNPKGQRECIVYGNSSKTEYTYERETFRLTSLNTTRTSDSRVLQDITYTYDPVGNITEIIDNSHGRVYISSTIVDPKNEFVYDSLYQLTEAQGREHLGLNNPLLSNYAEFKQSVFANINDSQQLSKYTQNYTYDKAGNLTRIRHINQTDSSRSFTRNMVIASGSNRAIPELMGTDVAAFFDPNGNMTSLEHLVGIDWNYRDNISKATIISRPAATDDAEYYVYDSAGQRVRKIKETLVAGNTEIEEKIYLGGVEIKRIRTGSLKSLERSDLHVMDDKTRIAIVNYWNIDTTNREVNSSADLNTNKIRYQYSNHLGSASLELSGSGQLISYEEYFPYGGTSFTTGNSQKEVKIKEYRYTGKERDDSTGLYYFGARYYAPWMGRWLSADPSGPSDGLNLYAYVMGNPITFIDPDGMDSTTVVVSKKEKVSKIGIFNLMQKADKPETTENALPNMRINETNLKKLISKDGVIERKGIENIGFKSTDNITNTKRVDTIDVKIAHWYSNYDNKRTKKTYQINWGTIQDCSNTSANKNQDTRYAMHWNSKLDSLKRAYENRDVFLTITRRAFGDSTQNFLYRFLGEMNDGVEIKALESHSNKNLDYISNVTHSNNDSIGHHIKIATLDARLRFSSSVPVGVSACGTKELFGVTDSVSRSPYEMVEGMLNKSYHGKEQATYGIEAIIDYIGFKADSIINVLRKNNNVK